MADALHVLDVSAAEFADKVVAESGSRPVLVDFWAAWCGPCRMLGPVLERLAEEYGGRFLLAKVDTEHNQELAMKFGIRGIPAVKLFRDGRVVDEFTGALPEAAIREFLGKHVASEAQERLTTLRAEREAGNLDRARQLAAQIREAGAGSAATVEAALVEIAAGNFDRASELAGEVAITETEHDLAQAIVQLAELGTLAQAAGGRAALEQRREAGDDSVPTRFSLAASLAVDGDYHEALELLLSVLQDDRRYRDDGARRAMLTVFQLAAALGGEAGNQLARGYRRKLTIYT